MNAAHLSPLELLKRHGIRPDKRLGQNFLVNAEALRRVVQAAELQADDWVLEIGAGIGNLTISLARQARKVFAVELDDDLIPVLRSVTQGLPNVSIVHGDILRMDMRQWFAAAPGAGSYVVVANIPYYITGRILRHLIDSPLPPRRMVVTLQQEVAERICAAPGKMSLLALSVQVFGVAHIAGRIPAAAFYPMPKVDSAIVRIDMHAEAPFRGEELDMLFQMAKAAFSQKRKNLVNALGAGMRWDKAEAQALLHAAGVEANRRAESLSLAEWKHLVQVYLERRK